MVTVCAQVTLLLQQSAACHVRVTVCGQVPLVTVASTLIVTFVPQHSSTAVGGSKLHTEPQGTILLAGQVSKGAVVSSTVTVWVQVVMLVLQSTTCHTPLNIFGHRLVETRLELIKVVTVFVQHPIELVGRSKSQKLPH